MSAEETEVSPPGDDAAVRVLLPDDATVGEVPVTPWHVDVVQPLLGHMYVCPGAVAAATAAPGFTLAATVSTPAYKPTAVSPVTSTTTKAFLV
jgi:hypothetical protein